jgi:hypothetical protein
MTNLPLTLALTPQAHADAQDFSRQQFSPEKSRQVYLNTLAIHAVHNYLSWLDLESDLTLGDSWDKQGRSLFNVADLVLPSQGRLHCLPVSPAEEQITLPEAIHEDLLGYVGVKFNASLKEAEILGFLSYQENSPTNTLHISQLEPLDNLLDLLESKQVVKLRQWLEDTFSSGWYSLEQISRESPALAYRYLKTINSRSTERGKVIDLGNSLAVALLVSCQLEEDNQNKIILQVHPLKGQIYLPANLKVFLWDRANPNINMQAISREQDNYLQLEFTGEVGEQFAVTIALESVEISEYFLI